MVSLVLMQCLIIMSHAIVLCFALMSYANVVCIIVTDNHPLVFAGVDGILEFEFWEGG
jgi:hypothetical protein